MGSEVTNKDKTTYNSRPHVFTCKKAVFVKKSFLLSFLGILSRYYPQRSILKLFLQYLGVTNRDAYSIPATSILSWKNTNHGDTP